MSPSTLARSEAFAIPRVSSAFVPQGQSALVEACDAIRSWARNQAAGDQVPSGARPPAEELRNLLTDLHFAVSGEFRPDAWTQSKLATAVAEASIAAGGWDERLQLARAAREITGLAPTDRIRGSVRRAELRILESLTGHPSEQIALAARARVDEIVQEIGGQGGSGNGFLARLMRRVGVLEIGSTMPRFLARDTAGNEVRSTFLAGQVTVLRFWREDSPASVLSHEQDARLLREFWDAPVALYGAAQSTERESHLAFLSECSFAGTQLFDGPISTALADELARAGDALIHGAGVSAPIGVAEAWHRPLPGAVFVIDEHGVIRGRDIPRNELRSLLHQLVKERRLRLRGELAGSGEHRR
ncbi:MAG: hypothetical protein AAGG01_02445 [Planctomycetota bacterium]